MQTAKAIGVGVTVVFIIGLIAAMLWVAYGSPGLSPSPSKATVTTTVQIVPEDIDR